MSAVVPVVAVRGSTGISLNYGPPRYDLVTAFTRDDSKTCKTMLFSPDGRFFAWVNGNAVRVVSTTTWKIVCEITRPKVSNIAFSPLGTYLITWEPFVVNQANPNGGPNLHFWRADTGDLVRAFIHKNQMGWEPQWSSDEQLCARLLNNDVLFYESGNFEVSVNKCSPGKVANFSLSPTSSESGGHYVLAYLPGQAGQPSHGRLFQYPKFDPAAALASKSFFQADRVEMFWNSKSTAVLLMTSTDIDKTGTSYYGKQTLHFVSTKGFTAMVLLGNGKECPVYSVQWSPKGTEFCVVYGFMPATASIYNLKCEPVFDFAPAPRNVAHYNPFGNILLLGGFGNLRGGIELWDAANRKLISRIVAPDTTQLEWSPDGEHIITATTAPRLREGNGFKIWHYTGSLLYERPWSKQEELWQVSWQTFPPSTFHEPAHIRVKPVDGIQPSAPPVKVQPYRPPSARGKENTKDEAVATTPIPEAMSKMSKKTIKLKKMREAKKAKKEAEGAQQQITPQNATPASHNTNNHNTSNHHLNGLTDIDLPSDPEKQKKIKKIRSKLSEIARLKEQKAAGKQLEINQLDKIKKEDELTKELQGLIL